MASDLSVPADAFGFVLLIEHIEGMWCPLLCTRSPEACDPDVPALPIRRGRLCLKSGRPVPVVQKLGWDLRTRDRVVLA